MALHSLHAITVFAAVATRPRADCCRMEGRTSLSTALVISVGSVGAQKKTCIIVFYVLGEECDGLWRASGKERITEGREANGRCTDL